MTPERLEIVWDQILSRDAELVRGMFQTLGADEQEIVFKHLKKMVTEEGWYAEQVKSARFALQIIRNSKMVTHPRKRKAGDKKASNK